MSKNAITGKKVQGIWGTYPKREVMVMIAKTTPATMIPILVPDVILIPEVTKSGCMSMNSGRDEDKLDQKERKNYVL